MEDQLLFRLQRHVEELNKTLCPVCGEHLLLATISYPQGGGHYKEHYHYTIKISCECHFAVEYIYCSEDDAGKRTFPKVNEMLTRALQQKTIDTLEYLHWNIRNKVDATAFEKCGQEKAYELQQYAAMLGFSMKTFVQFVPTWPIADFKEEELLRWLEETT